MSESAVRLDQFMQMCGVVGSGGQAKVIIQGGAVMVNGETETRRRRKLTDGDVIRFEEQDYPFVDQKADG